MTKNVEYKVEWIDYFFHLMSPSSKINYDMWPKNPPSEVTEEYNKEMLRLTNKVLGLMSEGLGLERNVLKSSLGGQMIDLEMKINMYPPCLQSELALEVEAHTDMLALTLLVPNDVPSLQFWCHDHWVVINHLKNSILIYVDDQLEVLSNGKYKGVRHISLVNKENMRMSWVVFVAPPHEAMIGPLPTLVNKENPSKFSTKTFAEFRHHKFTKLPQ